MVVVVVVVVVVVMPAPVDPKESGLPLLPPSSGPLLPERIAGGRRLGSPEAPSTERRAMEKPR